MISIDEEELLEVTNEIRALLNLLVKQHVKSWYTGLTQDEQLFQEFETISIHIQTTLAGRVQAVDWQTFLEVTLPELILRHLQDFNIAADRVRGEHSLEQAFLKLQTHQGITDQETYLMHVADALLIVLLPENDLMSEVAYTITREVLSELVFRTVVDRLSEPWFWDELLIRCCKHLRDFIALEKTNISKRVSDAFTSIRRSIQNSLAQWNTSITPSSQSMVRPGKAHWDYLRHPLHTYQVFSEQLSLRASVYDTAIPLVLIELCKPSGWPLLKTSIFSVLLPLLDILLGEEIPRLISRLTMEAISHNSLARMVRLARHVLFPNDQPSPGRNIPSMIDQLALRAELQSVLPQAVEIPFFQSKVINQVLLYKVLDTLLGTIFPELQKRSPQQLKEKLIHIRQANVEAEGSGGIRTGRLDSRPASVHSPLSASMLSTFEDGPKALRLV